MKIRQGFVSNSSSSSFTMMGYQVDADDILKAAAAALTDEQKEEYDYEDDDYELLELFFEKSPLDHELIDGELYVGLSYMDIKEDETLREFKNRVKEECNKLNLVSDESPYWMSETTYS